jgi:hypothetical protein
MVVHHMAKLMVHNSDDLISRLLLDECIVNDNFSELPKATHESIGVARPL